MTDQLNSISIGRKVGGIGLSMDTGAALYFLNNILKYRMDHQLNKWQSGTRFESQDDHISFFLKQLNRF